VAFGSHLTDPPQGLEKTTAITRLLAGSICDNMPLVADLLPQSSNVLEQSAQAINLATTTMKLATPFPLEMTMADLDPAVALVAPLSLKVFQQDLQAIHRFSTPLSTTPAMLSTTVMGMAKLHPIMPDGHPLSADHTPVTVDIAIQRSVTIERFEAINPVTPSLISAPTVLVAAPTPALMIVVAMANTDPSIVNCNPLMTNNNADAADKLPMSVVVAIEPSVAVKRFAAVPCLETI